MLIRSLLDNTMPGAFAHIASIHHACETSSLQQLDMPRHAKYVLATGQKLMTLGVVSPDYPYLALRNSKQKCWADKMHYDNVGGFIRHAVLQIKALTGAEQDKAFAWLSGYVAHVIADITIHPVIERLVGPYHENALQHRICEMHQDAYVWQTLGLGEVGYADVVSQSIGGCSDPDNNRKLDPLIATVWNNTLAAVYGVEADNMPDIHSWHRGFQMVVNSADEGHRLFPFARHVAANLGLCYPNAAEINDRFINHLPTPCGFEEYDAIFHRAVFNIQQYWCYLAEAVYAAGDTDHFLNWNLDTGQCETGQLTAWGEA
jgi:hypothetical protein